MPKACEPNLPETLKGAGPCRIEWEVKRRSGKPNWWCKTHELDASAPDGGRLEQCPGAWFAAVPLERQLDLDVADGEFSVWGAIPPAIQIGPEHPETGNVHVHHRAHGQPMKDVDGSFDIVRIHNGGQTLTVENMAAVAFSISELAGQTVKVLQCPKAGCGGFHIDEQKFATHPHTKHLCNRCGRNFRDPTPSISNPLADAYAILGLNHPAAPVRLNGALDLKREKYSSISMWPSNAAIVSTAERPEEEGIHVHAWDHNGVQIVDDTYSPVFLDGEEIDDVLLRALAVQRSLAHDTPIVSMSCGDCGTSLLSPSDGWIEPSTTHRCQACGAKVKTRRRAFLNPLADK